MLQTTPQLIQQGRELRRTTPRSGLGRGFEQHRDPLAILGAQNDNRIQSLVPLRWARMAESPFAFFRGAAALMAHDIAKTPVSGITVQACGDAHLSNFGLYASPERALVFDLNDFDETLPAAWEWDLERLVSSAAIAALNSGHSSAKARAVALASAAGYRRSIQNLATMTARQIFETLITVDDITALASTESAKKSERKARVAELERAARKARSRTAGSAAATLTEVVDGQVRLIDQPPVMTRLSAEQLPSDAVKVPELYKRTLSHKLQVLLGRYQRVDFALRVGGVGSVGTRCFIQLAVDSSGDPLILQIKEANRSVLAPFAKPSRVRNQGRRVVNGQRIMQVVSDPFLGWVKAEGQDFYVRQFRDMKGSFELERFSLNVLIGYAMLCGSVLARAHAQSCEPALIAGYIGTGEAADQAFADFAMAYAARNEQDHAALVSAIERGAITAA